MELPEHLETIAEVAVAFTGFAGLVSVLGRSNLDPKIRLWRVQVMIVTSLAAMFGALTPSTLLLLIPDADAFWRVSSLILLLLVSGQLAFVYRSMPVEQATGPLRLMYGPVPIALTLGSVSVQLGLGTVALGFIPSAAASIYSVTLIFLLLASSFHFLRLVRSAQSEGDD